MKNSLVLCICLAIHFLQNAGFRGLNDLKRTFFQELQPTGRKMLRPSHGVVIILGVFIIFGLPVTIQGEGNDKMETRSNGNGTVVVPVPGLNLTASEPPTTTAKPPTSPTTTECECPVTQLPSNIPETITIIRYTFLGNYDIQKLSELLNDTASSNVSIQTTNDIVGIGEPFEPFKILVHENEKTLEASRTITVRNPKIGNKHQVYSAILQFKSSASAPTTTTTTPVVPELATSPTATIGSITTTERSLPPRPPSKTGMKVLLFLCLSMMVILISCMVCLVDGCWERFTNGCAQSGSRVRTLFRERRGMGSVINPIRNRLLPNGRVEAHADYPNDTELYDRL